MEIVTDTGKYIFWFLLTLVVSSLVEYVLHLLMHLHPKICQFHVEHHEQGTGQGVLGEFRDYVVATAPLMGIMFLFSWKIGLSCTCGGVAYAAFAAYAHQVQHESPNSCTWMAMPIHHVHHKYDQWHHNFGIGVDWWDRVFGTYKPMEWLVTATPDAPKGKALKIRWR